MQRLSEIRAILASAGRRPRRGMGQHFLVDANLMGKLLELADLDGHETVLEVGPGTGSLTEELLDRSRKVLAAEKDPVLAGLLAARLGARAGLTVLVCDALAGKHVLAPEVLQALGEAEADLVANLPYGIAVPLILNCLLLSWRAVRLGRGARFRRLTFTAQRELAERLTAGAGEDAYGPAGVIVALLARATPGRAVPPEAFWPRPKVQSQILRLDFDPDRAGRLADAEMLSAVLAATFGYRRKKIATAGGRRRAPFDAERFTRALLAAGVDPSSRPEQVAPEGFLALANLLSPGGSNGTPPTGRRKPREQPPGTLADPAGLG